MRKSTDKNFIKNSFTSLEKTLMIQNNFSLFFVCQWSKRYFSRKSRSFFKIYAHLSSALKSIFAKSFRSSFWENFHILGTLLITRLLGKSVRTTYRLMCFSAASCLDCFSLRLGKFSDDHRFFFISISSLLITWELFFYNFINLSF